MEWENHARYFKKEHQEFRKRLRAFVKKEISPKVNKWEKAGAWDRNILKLMAKEGFLGVQFPLAHGGQGKDFWHGVVFCEELPRCGAYGVTMGIMLQTNMATPVVSQLGTPEQIDRFLKPALSGDLMAAIAITEPDAGSDANAIKTKAAKHGGDYIINGRKTFITNGAAADFVTMAVKTEADQGKEGLSLLLVPTDAKGFHATRITGLMGSKALGVAELVCEDCRVPASCLLGEENKGAYYLMEGVQSERLTSAINALSFSRLIIEEAIEFTRTRHTFGRPISKHQVIAHRIADMVTQVTAAQAFVYEVADKFDRKEPCVKELSMAKYFVGEMIKRVSDSCLHILGGHGYTDNYMTSRLFYDLRLFSIGGGSSEIMKEIICRQM